MSGRSNALHLVLPDGIDDPARPSGGNLYDRRVSNGLAALGWTVREYAVPGRWPHPDEPAVDALAGTLAAIPDGGLAMVDGLVASAAPPVVVRHTDRLHLAVLVHLPLGVERPLVSAAERGLLAGCAAVVTTSGWTRTWLLEHYELDAQRVVVVEPGVDAADPAPGTVAGGSLLVVGSVSRDKGHDVLAAALADIGDLPWHCVCIGSLDAYPVFVTAFRERLRRAGVDDQVELRGPLRPAEVHRAYAAADLLVVPSRAETYGMVVIEALAHGVPVVASSVGGVPEALGHDPEGRRPGLLLRAGEGPVLGRALRWWLTDPILREDLRDAARARRPMLADWDVAASRLASALRRAW